MRDGPEVIDTYLFHFLPLKDFRNFRDGALLRQGVFSVEICRDMEYYGIGTQCEEREAK